MLMISVNRLLRDAEHYETKLGKIDGAADTGQYLIGIVKEKTIVAPAALAPPATPVPGPQAQTPPPTTPAIGNNQASEQTTENAATSDGQEDGQATAAATTAPESS